MVSVIIVVCPPVNPIEFHYLRAAIFEHFRFRMRRGFPAKTGTASAPNQSVTCI
jgi:hypothetical protein